MPRKKKQTGSDQLPQMDNEIWEVGHQLIEDTDFIFVIQAGESGGILYGQPASTDSPASSLSDAVKHAIQTPLIGDPRRPSTLLVTDPAEATALHAALDDTAIAVEVVETLAYLDALSAELTRMMDGISHDYRTRAAQSGAPLTDQNLRDLFQAARDFYRKALWTDYDDTALFHLTLTPQAGDSTELYGLIMGSMGAELGLVLYDSLDDLSRMYEINPDDFEAMLPNLEDEQELYEDQLSTREAAEQLAGMMSIPSTCLTFDNRHNTPDAIIEEAKALKLPLAKRSTYPLILQTGQLGLQVATSSALADMYVAMQAILALEAYLETDDGEDDELSLTLTQPALAGFVPEMTVKVELIENPFALDSGDDDDFDFDMDDDDDIDIEALHDSMQTMLEALSRPSPAQKKTSSTPAGPIDPKTAQVYTLCVYLVDGPIDEEYADQEISRRILILGHQTLHDLHEAIFDAFEREEEHLYEFNLGASPQDRSQIYFYNGPWEMDDDEETGNPMTTTLDDLGIEPKRRFGYTFDMGDQWEHMIEVISTKTGAGKGDYPRLGKKVGVAPPQYPDDDEDFE